ncbi:hypothetical protein DPMN_073367 [Dreissena polymorpha]|uniref:Uncharacterized protein n=1 Tax=Dreissena polymorpha TaxID=45954 RepID=A0A9D4BZ11_DREPO|nr:hypothetical protein DPMN_073367 [Dreissena polymorpha]
MTIPPNKHAFDISDLLDVSALNVKSTRHIDNQPNAQYADRAIDKDVTTCSYTNYSWAGRYRAIPTYWIIFYETNMTFREGYEIVLILHQTYLGLLFIFRNN